MFIATLIAAERLTSGDLSVAEDALAAADIDPMGRSWIEPDLACDLLFSAAPGPARRALEGLLPAIDVVVQGEIGRRKRLLVADMDSTMITVECIDELADFAGLKPVIAEVTERAMRGELVFEDALRERVRLLAGLEEDAIERCRDERVRVREGARELVRTMRANGAHTLLVSGGFTSFAGPVAREIGFDDVLANRLDIEGGRLAGTVGQPIVGADSKRRALVDASIAFAVPREETMAVGDGANDLPMITEAGLGVAFHAKPALDAAADASIRHCDLTALLYAQGYSRSEWAPI